MTRFPIQFPVTIDILFKYFSQEYKYNSDLFPESLFPVSSMEGIVYQLQLD